MLTGTAIIEHFGSTAVPGLGGKGIIDIYVVVDKDNLNKTVERLQKGDYELRPDAGTEDKIFFRRILNTGNGEQRYHVHLTLIDNTEFKKDIAFRDHLKTHPEDLKTYARIKIKAANEANNNKDKYMKIKEPVIQEILRHIGF